MAVHACFVVAPQCLYALSLYTLCFRRRRGLRARTYGRALSSGRTRTESHANGGLFLPCSTITAGRNGIRGVDECSCIRSDSRGVLNWIYWLILHGSWIYEKIYIYIITVSLIEHFFLPKPYTALILMLHKSNKAISNIIDLVEKKNKIKNSNMHNIFFFLSSKNGLQFNSISFIIITYD